MTGAAAALGTIWSMHFIGRLGFTLPMSVSYDVPLTLPSLAAAIVFAGLAFASVSGRSLRLGGFVLGGALVGCGIAAMQYIGIAVMKMEPPIRYHPALLRSPS